MDSLKLAKIIENLSDFTSVNHLSLMIDELDKETKVSLENSIAKLRELR